MTAEPINIRALATKRLEQVLRTCLAIIFSIAQSKVAPSTIISPMCPENFGIPKMPKLPINNKARALSWSQPIFSLRKGTASSATQRNNVLWMKAAWAAGMIDKPVKNRIKAIPPPSSPIINN